MNLEFWPGESAGEVLEVLAAAELPPRAAEPTTPLVRIPPTNFLMLMYGTKES